MGCFLACFGGEKGQRPRKRGRKSLRGDRNRAKESYQALITSPSPKKLVAKEVVANDDPIPQLREKSQEQEEESFGCGGCRKKVTFDLNVKTYEAEEEKKAGEEEEEGEGGRAAGGPVAFPANHRYGNCAGSDDEDDVIDDTEEEEEEEEEEEYSDFDEEEEGDEEEESYDSFPLPTAVADKATTARDRSRSRSRSRSRYVHSVLNPVQNLSQWKEAKVRGLPPKNPDKENVDGGNIKSRTEVSKTTAFGPELPTFKVSDTSVDASLSAWLVTPQSGGKAPRERRLAQV